jgi:hypothetical protein
MKFELQKLSYGYKQLSSKIDIDLYCFFYLNYVIKKKIIPRAFYFNLLSRVKANLEDLLGLVSGILKHTLLIDLYLQVLKEKMEPVKISSHNRYI